MADPVRQLSLPAEAERVPWVRPIFEFDEALLADIRLALTSGRVTNDGPLLRQLEQRLADYLGVDDCVAVASGSAALFLASRVLAVDATKAVLPSFTYIATLNALVQAGISPVFCDIDPDTWTMSPTHLRQILADDQAIRLVVPINVFGVPPDLQAIRTAMTGTNAALVLDNAHGMGTEEAGARHAREPLAQTYSFHATKILPGIEGGAVIAPQAPLLAEIRRLRNHGLAPDPFDSTPGYNAKMSELHAAVALRSLHGLDGVLERRRSYAARLRRVLIEECASTFAVQRVPDSVRSNFQNLAVLCRLRDGQDVTAIQAELDVHGIETRRYFWPPLHQLRLYGGRFSLPVTDAVGRSVICLPLHSDMEAPVLERIETALRRTAARFG